MLFTQTARLAGTRTLMLSRSVSSTAARPVSLVTPAELHKLLSSKNEEDHPCVLDASWHMPGSGRQPFQEYRKKRIEGAAFWDVCVWIPHRSGGAIRADHRHLVFCAACRDQIASKSDVGVPHNMPSVSQFEDACSRLGIKRDSHVIVYDTVGVFSAPRTAFTFKVSSARAPVQLQCSTDPLFTTAALQPSSCVCP
jgi:thiosulfate/3-mercaptopyruvate sulfurtransferase